MATQVCKATIRAVSDISHINLRTGPGTHADVLGSFAVGTAGLLVLDVQPDERGANSGGRVYQWLQLQLPDGRRGWARDDLVEIVGDCSFYGYGTLSLPTRASNLTRAEGSDKEALPADEVRERKAAFNISAAFEGGGYATFQTYDAGIVSYGRFQCTLASGSLAELIESYLEKASGASADQLRAQFMERVRQKEFTLRTDAVFKSLLLRLARDPQMQAAQNDYATSAYWNPAYLGSMLPRGIETALGKAFVFDTALNHGSWGAERDYLRPAEQSLGAAIKSKLGANGLTEQQLIRTAAQLRRDRLYALAAAKGLGGLRVRGDFWVQMANQSDWDLLGDAAGEVEIKAGRKVQVKQP
jgi:hypothetical protein